MDTRPHTRQEIGRWAHGRQPHEREPVPAVGERLLLREADFAEPVPAVVTAVQDMSSPHDHWNRYGGLEAARGPGVPDQNVWNELEQCPNGHWQPSGSDHCMTCGTWIPDFAPVRHEMKDDPWPWVQVAPVRLTDDGRDQLDADGNPVTGPPRWCREARVRGSAGWLRTGSRAHTGNYESGE